MSQEQKRFEDMTASEMLAYLNNEIESGKVRTKSGKVVTKQNIVKYEDQYQRRNARYKVTVL
jgi:hypothetical protein